MSKQKNKKGLKKTTAVWRDRLLNSPWPLVLILAVLSLSIAGLLSPLRMANIPKYRLGQVAQTNIKATKPLLIEDNKSTEEKRRGAAEAVLSVYDYDPSLVKKISDKLLRGFAGMREFLRTFEGQAQSSGKQVATKKNRTAPPPAQSKEELIENARGQLNEIWGIKVDPPAFEVLMNGKFSEDFETLILELLNSVMYRGIVGSKQMLLAERNKGIVVRTIQNKQEIKVVDLNSYLSVSEARGEIRSRAINFIRQYKYDSLKVATAIAQDMVQPNLTLNRLETERRKKEAYNAQKPVFYRIEKGEMIVREGGKITPKIFEELSAVAVHEKKRKVWVVIGGLTVLVGLFFFICASTSKLSFAAKVFSVKNSLFLSATLFLTFLLTLPTIFQNQNISTNLFEIPISSIYYSIPICIGSMLVSIFLGIPIALIFSVASSFLAALMLGKSLYFFIFFLLGSFVAACGVKECRDRATLIKTGLLVGLVNMVTVVAINMILERLPSAMAVFDVSFALLGGLLSGIIVTGLLPLVEITFGYSTNIKLLELANLDSPVLRDLMLRAPGTYYHSILVGSMVETAAEAIGANPLLSKVSAYYHDAGKAKKPDYFIENQKGGSNKHEKLATSMSALILISHVKDGVEVARKHRLGKEIIDIIKQHHGTSLITYFYQKALEAHNNDQSAVQEENYRYPGPKPQTKEAGLVLLADHTEAASRTLQDPTPSRIQGMVQKIINKVFSDGQLDECELTLKDLHQIAKSFNKILNGIFHQRIEYPESLEKARLSRKSKNGNSHRKPAAVDKDKSKADQDQDQEDLKRLGL